MSQLTSTYQNLFSLLLSLGFQEKIRTQTTFQQRIFFHSQTETVLAFGRRSDETITAADILSTEVHLQAKGITDQTLDSLLTSNHITAQ